MIAIAIPGYADTKTISFSGFGSSGNGVVATDRTESPFKLTFAKVSASTAPTYYASDLRMYNGSGNGNTITISVESGYKMTGMVFTATGTNYNFSNSSPSVGSMSISGTTNTWSAGSSDVTEVTFQNKGTGQVRISQVVITYEKISSTPTTPTAPADPKLSIEDGATVKVGDKLEITCATEGATLTGYVGNEEIEDEPFPYTYTFTDADSDEGECNVYVVASKDGKESNTVEATYIVESKEEGQDPEQPEEGTWKWVLVNDKSELSDGSKYIIAHKNGNKYYAMNTTVTSNKVESNEVQVSDNILTPVASTAIFTLKSDNEKWKLYCDNNSQYLNVATGSTNLNFNTSGSSNTIDFEDDYVKIDNTRRVFAQPNYGSYAISNWGGNGYFKPSLYKYQLVENTPDPDPIAPSTITITPNGGDIDTNTEISIEVDADATKPVIITYSINNENYDNTYENAFKLPEGKYTLNVKASNYDEETGKGGIITETAEFNVTKGPDQYQIVFGNNGSDSSTVLKSDDLIDYIEKGNEYVASASDITNAYKGSTGIKLGSSGTAGKFTLNLTDKGKVNATKIVVNASLYSATETASLKVNGSNAISISSTTAADYTFDLNGDQISSIVIEESLSGKHRCYVNAVTVDYGTSTVQEPILSIANDSEIEIGSKLEISCATEGAALYGTIGETSLNGETLPYEYIFEKIGDVKVDITAKKDGYEDSKKVEASYTVYQVAATPVMNIENGAKVEYGKTLTISTSTEGAKLYGNIGGVILEGENSPYELVLNEVGEIKISVLAKAIDFRNSNPLEAVITVDAPDGPSALVFSEPSTVVEDGTEITVTSAGAEKMTLITYSIDGTPYPEVVEADQVSFKVDKMNRRFAVSAEKNGFSSVVVDKFYKLGKRIENTFIPVKEVVELNTGDKLVLGIRHDFNGTSYYGFMGGVNTGETGMPNIKKNASFLYVEDTDLVNSEEILVTDLNEGVLQLTVEVGQDGYFLRTEDGKYLKSAKTKDTSDITLDEKSNASQYSLVYDEEIKSVYLVAPNNDTDNVYAIQINTSGPIFASYKVNHSAPAQWPALIFRQENFKPEKISYEFSLTHKPFIGGDWNSPKKVVDSNYGDEQDATITTSVDENGVHTYSTTLDELVGDVTLSLDGNTTLMGHSKDAVCPAENCDGQHAPVVVLAKDGKYTLVTSDHENAATITTDLINEHGFANKLVNANMTVTMDPFKSIEMEVNADNVATGVDGIFTDSDSEAVYFNLQGVRVANPDKGVYIIVKNGKAEKVIL